MHVLYLAKEAERNQFQKGVVHALDFPGGLGSAINKLLCSIG